MKAIFELDSKTIEQAVAVIDGIADGDEPCIEVIFELPAICSVMHFDKRVIMTLIGDLAANGKSCLIKVEE